MADKCCWISGTPECYCMTINSDISIETDAGQIIIYDSDESGGKVWIDEPEHAEMIARQLSAWAATERKRRQ